MSADGYDSLGTSMWRLQWFRAWQEIGAEVLKEHAAIVGAPQLVHMRRGA